MTNEKEITFSCDDLQLQGRLKHAGKKGVVVTHPHPLYGGDLNNPVVQVITRAFQKKGFTTLRFNFRGVGHSQGTYDEGHGEKRDTCRALAYLAQVGIQEFYLAGYSFGAWINAQILPEESRNAQLAMVSPPLAFMDFGSTKEIPNLKLVIAGSRDEIAPVHMIRQQMPFWNPAAHLAVIPGADHFYSGYLETLEATLSAHIATYLDSQEP
jgi:uncharacterized protein